MKITKLELKNFKRFDDLTIDLTTLPEPPKLVLLIGTNGSGKSSVFDGFEILNIIFRNEGGKTQHLESYYKKSELAGDYGITAFLRIKGSSGENINTKIVLRKLNDIPNAVSFYGRSSFRQVPKLTRKSLGQSNVSFLKDSDRSETFIDRDNRFENDIEKVASLILSDVFKGNTSTEEIKESYVNPINRSFENIFGTDANTGVKLISIKPPLDGKTAEILFEKGKSVIPYDFLSSGEKEIFNILLNLLTRREYFQDTVYFFDEIDLHLNTQLQKNLIKEITENWIPENCQLWTASHSLGFIEYANEAEHAAIVDFDNLDFDIPQVIYPSPKNNFDVFEIAVSKEFLATIFEGKKLVFAENTDTSLYNNLKLKDTIFLVAKDKADVFHKAKNNPDYNGLIDRDYLTDKERSNISKVYKNLYVLDYYSVENYLYHPDNLEEYYKSVDKAFDKSSYITAIKRERPIIRDGISLGLVRARESYSFFRDEKAKIVRDEESLILQMFDSEDFETFFKVFPAKDYGKEIPERQNISKTELAKTNWFKAKISEVLIK